MITKRVAKKYFKNVLNACETLSRLLIYFIICITWRRILTLEEKYITIFYLFSTSLLSNINITNIRCTRGSVARISIFTSVYVSLFGAHTHSVSVYLYRKSHKSRKLFLHSSLLVDVTDIVWRSTSLRNTGNAPSIYNLFRQPWRDNIIFACRRCAREVEDG